MTRITIFITVLILVLAGCSAEDGATPDATSDSRTSATATVSPSVDADVSANWTTFENTEAGYSIRHPSDWVVYPDADGGVTLASEEITSASGRIGDAESNIYKGISIHIYIPNL